MPPRAVTLAISATAAGWSGTKLRTSPETTTSTDAASSGIWVALAWCSTARAARCRRAVSRNPSEGSIAVSEAGAQ